MSLIQSRNTVSNNGRGLEKPPLRPLAQLRGYMEQFVTERRFGDEPTVLMIEELGALAMSLRKYLERVTGDARTPDLDEVLVFLEALTSICCIDWVGVLQGKETEEHARN